MGMFEEMGFCGNIDFLAPSITIGEGDPVPETEPEATMEEDYTDEVMDVDELERRMWMDRMLLRKLKEQSKRKDGVDTAKQCQSWPKSRRGEEDVACSRWHPEVHAEDDGICKAQGFVYGIIPEKGKPVSGASNNLHAWWKEKVRFDRNGPAHDVNLFNLGMGSAKDRLMVPLLSPLIKGEISNTEFSSKRKPTDELVATADHKIYNRVYLRCPYSDYHLGKLDRSSRNNQQANSPYKNVRTGLGISNFEITEDKLTVFSLPFGQPKPATPPLNPTQSTFSLS